MDSDKPSVFTRVSMGIRKADGLPKDEQDKFLKDLWESFTLEEQERYNSRAENILTIIEYKCKKKYESSTTCKEMGE